jgi:hypothetical protein
MDMMYWEMRAHPTEEWLNQCAECICYFYDHRWSRPRTYNVVGQINEMLEAVPPPTVEYGWAQEEVSLGCMPREECFAHDTIGVYEMPKTTWNRHYWTYGWQCEAKHQCAR